MQTWYMAVATGPGGVSASWFNKLLMMTRSPSLPNLAEKRGRVEEPTVGWDSSHSTCPRRRAAVELHDNSASCDCERRRQKSPNTSNVPGW